jgi:DNA-binding NtrC family response regulator
MKSRQDALRGGRMKILIVDDDDAVLICIGSRLRSGGFEVKEASTGDGAMYVYEHQGPFVFVLSDYRFVPGAKIKDGVQLVTAIHEINPHQRMAMMTADPKEAREKLPKALWHLPVLVKPFKVEQLLRVLREPVLPL